jgi:polyisoprenoid-binding protein YceI
MAGTTKPVEVKASYLVNAAGDLQIKGTHKISMPDFGMTPPTAMMGTITVGDDVTVTFDMLLTKSQTNL